MIKKLPVVVLTLVPFCFLNAAAGQPRNLSDHKECPAPVFGSHEVTRRAKITLEPQVRSANDLDPNFRGRVVVDAVLCRTGRVTDIKVTEGSSSMVNEFIARSVSLIEFVPAEMNWHTVSQKIQLEFEINQGEVKEVVVPQANARLVESVNVLGNRRLTAKRILEWIQTGAGEPYDEARVKRDFNALLATGQFDKTTTRVFIEDEVRDGVGVYFEVRELPAVGVVSFEGLKIDPAAIREAWKDARLKLDPGEPYSPEAGKAAIRVIKQLLDAKALNYTKVELREEPLASQTVNLTFVISNQ